MAPGPHLGGDHAVGDRSSGGVYNGGGGGGGGGEGGGRSCRDRGASISDDGEDGTTGGTGRMEGSHRACFRGDGARDGEYTGRSGHGGNRGEARDGQERTERRERGCNGETGESRGGGRTGADEGVVSVFPPWGMGAPGSCIGSGSAQLFVSGAQKRQRNNSSAQSGRRFSLDYLVSTPPHRCPKLPTTLSPGNCKSMSTSTVEGRHNASSTKRKLELVYDGDWDTLQGSTSGAYSEPPYYQQFHDLFVCPHDLNIPLGSLAHYAANNRRVDYEVPAGDIHGQDFLSPTDDTRVIIARSARILQQLHENDRSLAGKFDFTNFTVYRKKRVKLSGIEPGGLERLRKCHSDGDYSTFALQAHKHFFPNKIPRELNGWFCLLLEQPTSHEDLISHSISLMEATRAIFCFSHIYGEFKAFKKNSHDCQVVVDYLNKRHYGWRKIAKLNEFTRDVLEYQDPDTGKIAVYGNDAGELLRLCRNLVTHVLGKSLSIQLSLTHKHILAIINSVFPGLLFDFQVAMLNTRNGTRLAEFQK